MEEQIEIRSLSSAEIGSLIELRKKNIFLQDNSLMTLMGDEFLKMILERFIASDNHVCQCSFLKENHQMDGYILISKDILKTVIWMLPVFKKMLFKNDLYKGHHLKTFLKIIYIAGHCIFSRPFFNRAFILEICQWNQSPAFYSPMALYTHTMKIFYSTGIHSIKMFYYRHNVKLEKFIQKLSTLVELQLIERKKLFFKPEMKIIELVISPETIEREKGG